MQTSERVVWFFYKVRWGYQDEFVDLFRRNHYPILAAQIGDRFTSVRAYQPKFHGDGRADWTFAVEIRYRDTEAMLRPSNEAEIARRLFPDQERFRREEKRRFELLDAHWDVPLKGVDLESGSPE